MTSGVSTPLQQEQAETSASAPEAQQAGQPATSHASQQIGPGDGSAGTQANYAYFGGSATNNGSEVTGAPGSPGGTNIQYSSPYGRAMQYMTESTGPYINPYYGTTGKLGLLSKNA